MRISEHRYARDLRRLQLARRFIHLRVRTCTIATWTGLSDERIQHLWRAYDLHEPRQRGATPRSLVPFLRPTLLHSEASAAVGLARAFGAIPPHPIPDARRTLPGLSTGERLCQVYELYTMMVPRAALSMDQLILLAITLAEGDKLRLERCPYCGAAILTDPISIDRRICLFCRRAEARGGVLVSEPLPPEAPTAEPISANADPQQELFERH